MEIRNKKNHPLKHAFNGLRWALRTQNNYRIHLLISLAVVISGVFFRISYYEWLLIFVLITVGLVVEAINTALEAATDAITREWSEDIKIAKDVSAAAMLTFAFGALCIAVLIFIPKIVVFLGF